MRKCREACGGFRDPGSGVRDPASELSLEVEHTPCLAVARFAKADGSHTQAYNGEDGVNASIGEAVSSAGGSARGKNFAVSSNVSRGVISGMDGVRSSYDGIRMIALSHCPPMTRVRSSMPRRNRARSVAPDHCAPETCGAGSSAIVTPPGLRAIRSAATITAAV